MKLASVEIENFRAIEKLALALDPRLTVLHGPNAHGGLARYRELVGNLADLQHGLCGHCEIDQRESTLACRLSPITATPAKVTTCPRERGKSR